MQDLDSLLNTSLAEIADKAVVPDDGPVIYMGEPGSKLRLSNSTLGLFNSCERKFQKARLLKNNKPRDESPAMTFGKGFGAAAQLYMILRTKGHSITESMDSAIWELFMQYQPFHMQDDRRFIERCIYTIQAAQPFHERLLMEWEIAEFNGRFAAELSFRLDIDDFYYYVGYLDLVLRHKKSGRYAVADYKTTSLTAVDLSPYYKHSDQVLGYSIVLDKIAGSSQAEFDTNYWIAQLSSRSTAALYEPKFFDYTFPKTMKDRMEWFLKLYLDVNKMKSLQALEIYPKRLACTSYNKVCQYFNECQFSGLDQPAIYEEDTIEYDFVYSLQEIFEEHHMRLIPA